MERCWRLPFARSFLASLPARRKALLKTGEKVDHVIDTIKNGGEEPTGDKIQDEVDKARDKAAEATDKVEGK